MFSKTVLIAIFVTVLCQLTQQKAIGDSPDYRGCDTDYRCFGLPNKCVADKSCAVLLKTQPLGNGDVQFVLNWARPSTSTDNWVAAALSTDNMMGGDSATVFTIGADQSVTDVEGLTFVDKANHKAGVTPKQVSGITVQSEKYANGLLTAKWTRAQKTSVDKFDFDMKSNKYYILLAYGPVKDDVIKHHSHQGASDSAVDLESKP